MTLLTPSEGMTQVEAVEFCGAMSPLGSAAHILDRLDLVPQAPPAPGYRIVHRPAALAEGLEPPVDVPFQVAVEHPPELVEADLRPVPAVVELLLQGAEEALRPGVVGAAVLPGHRAHHAALRADPLPGAGAVGRPAVGVRDQGLGESTPISFTPLRRHRAAILLGPVGPLELLGAEVAQRRVRPDPVVEALDV